MARTLCTARPTSCAARNMVGDWNSVSTSPVSGFSMPSCSRLTADWEIERLPAVATAMTRSPGDFEGVELAEGRDVVQAGIGPGVRDHHETVANEDACTIGHYRSPNRPKFFRRATSSQFQGGVQPQFPRRGMHSAAKSCLAGRPSAAWTNPGAQSGSCTRQNDVRLNSGGDLAIAMLACDGGCGVFGGGLQLVGAPGFDLVAQRVRWQ